MNLIVVCLDTFRQDHVGAYHGGRPAFAEVPACRTPNLDAFARQSVVFDRVYPCGLPTIPVRMELMTGQFSLPYRPWQPLVPSDVTVAEILRREGYVCGLVSDNYHFRAPGMNYHRGFNEYRWIRGQEYDPYNSAPSRRPVEDFVNDRYPDLWRGRVAQYLTNTDDMTTEETGLPARVVDAACDWLVRNRPHERLFLWIDSFDPHEPWNPPPAFDTYLDPGYRGKRLIMPMGGRAADWASPEEIREIRGLYAGEASYVDSRLGSLFERLETHGYLDDSIVLVLADHGHPLADHGKFLKGADRLYSELLNVPFMLRLPGRLGEIARPRRIGALAQFPDVLPTLLDLLGLAACTGAMHGRSLRPVLSGETDRHRDAVIAGYHDGIDRCIRDERWSYIERPDGEPDELYDLLEDPRETVNRIDDRRDEAVRLAGRFGNTWRRRPSRAVKGIQGRYEVASGAVE